MKKICTSLREHAKNIIDFEKKKNVPVNKRITEIILRPKSMLYLRKKILKKFGKDKSYSKVRDHCCYASKYRGAAQSICKFKI